MIVSDWNVFFFVLSCNKCNSYVFSEQFKQRKTISPLQNIQGKSASPEMVARRVAKCGDGSHPLSHEHAHENGVWGYGDKDLNEEDIQQLE